MSGLLDMAQSLIRPQGASDTVVPPTGFTARLTVFVSAAMAFLAVFALALTVSANRLADRWASELAESATVRISAPPAEVEIQVAAVLRVLDQTAGVASARILTTEEQRALLAPWFGPDVPLDTLPVPTLVEVIQDGDGFDAEGLRLRLSTEAPGAVLDDHTRWRAPLVQAASRLNFLGWLAVILIGATTGAMITLAANAALAANAQVITVLRLVGAHDRFIAQAFVRRFTLRTILGAGIGTLIGLVAVIALPNGPDDGFLTGLGFSGAGWLLPLTLPILGGIVAFFATRAAADRTLKGLR
ncbi:ABC transporter permease [Nereida sp. MMG025]|uniref:cell division protein FtsX n=1 Tax=Nereida sp. MMG025 TaxID=2909981 RepID=UPI001F3000A1|nr:cell division protein FtsX [Nereida sp. MMG025]MCF6444343.1 cell division protein FtsX [Nereida sp. MMG025]